MSSSHSTATADREGTVSTPLAILTLASRFIAETAGTRGAWPALLEAWADEQGLDAATAGQVRAAVCRERIVGAIGRHRGRL